MPESMKRAITPEPTKQADRAESCEAPGEVERAVTDEFTATKERASLEEAPARCKRARVFESPISYERAALSEIPIAPERRGTMKNEGWLAVWTNSRHRRSYCIKPHGGTEQVPEDHDDMLRCAWTDPDEAWRALIRHVEGGGDPDRCNPRLVKAEVQLKGGDAFTGEVFLARDSKGDALLFDRSIDEGVRMCGRSFEESTGLDPRKLPYINGDELALFDVRLDFVKLAKKGDR